MPLLFLFLPACTEGEDDGAAKNCWKKNLTGCLLLSRENLCNGIYGRWASFSECYRIYKMANGDGRRRRRRRVGEEKRPICRVGRRERRGKMQSLGEREAEW
jgi:hypothetical protein